MTEATFNKYILIVEDDPFLSDIYKGQYEQNGYEAEVTSNVKMAMEMLETRTPDLITLDMIMPGMTGFDFLEILSSKEAWKDIPVVVLTNLGQEEEKRKCQESHPCTYLVKTETSIDQILEVVKEHLGL